MDKKLNCMLLVDDDESHNYFSQLVIEENAVTKHVRTAWNGSEAIDYVTHRGKFKENGDTYPNPDLILLDLNMPLMNGWEFMEEYQKLDEARKRDIMIVILTTSENPDDREKARRIQGIADYKNKPLTAEILEEIVQKYFQEHPRD
jgi:CheY-like chemotaxis protein